MALHGGVSTAQDQTMKEVGNNSYVSVYRPKYAERPLRETSEAAEN